MSGDLRKVKITVTAAVRDPPPAAFFLGATPTTTVGELRVMAHQWTALPLDSFRAIVAGRGLADTDLLPPTCSAVVLLPPEQARPAEAVDAGGSAEVTLASRVDGEVENRNSKLPTDAPAKPGETGSAGHTSAPLVLPGTKKRAEAASKA
jgi:hypothetical protein